MRILIVDNDRNTVETLRAALRGENQIIADSAYGGKQALAILTNDPNYDLLVLDIMMPEVSGIDVCSAMATNDEMRKIPVLIISALPIESKEFKGSMEKFKELSVVKGVIEKPFGMADFVSKIYSIVPNSGASLNAK
jgi:CheY-like chemotaxis protein